MVFPKVLHEQTSVLNTSAAMISISSLHGGASLWALNADDALLWQLRTVADNALLSI